MIWIEMIRVYAMAKEKRLPRRCVSFAPRNDKWWIAASLPHPFVCFAGTLR
jgi:hypothetical protein